jgi:hypothetical protein
VSSMSATAARPESDPGERFVVFRDGVGKDGEALTPVRSSVGLALTRSLVAVNACRCRSIRQGRVGTMFSLVIPAELVAAHPPHDKLSQSGPREAPNAVRKGDLSG